MRSHIFFCHYNLHFELLFFRRDDAVICMDFVSREITFEPDNAFVIGSLDLVFLNKAAKRMKEALRQIHMESSSAKNLLHIFRLCTVVYKNQSVFRCDGDFLAYGIFCERTESHLEEAIQILRMVNELENDFESSGNSTSKL